MRTHDLIPGTTDILLVADHAGEAVPPDIDLGLSDEDMRRHIAVDIGIAELTRHVAELLGATAILAHLSRLVFDPNRDPESSSLSPVLSDGTHISGNEGLSDIEIAKRLALHDDYHDAISARLDQSEPDIFVSLHSFTPELRSQPDEERPWDAALLYNRDRATAQAALKFLRHEGLNVGDNQPYSGVDTGYTVIRHAEARGLPYLFLEIRQDHLADAAGIALWSKRVAALVRHIQKVREQDGE